MLLNTQIDFLCNSFGDTSLPENERWKCIKYIFAENPIIDVQLLIKKGEIIYINNSEIGPGFYILGTPNADFGLPKNDEKVITFIPLNLLDKVSILTKFIDINFGENVDIDLSNDETSKLMVNNMEPEDSAILVSDYTELYPSEEEFLVIIG